MDIKETRKEYSGLTNVSISDLSIIDYELTGILEKKGINNLAELFEAYGKGSLKCGRNTAQRKNIRTLRGIVELLKYKYYGEDLIADEVLDRVSIKDTTFDDYIHMPGTKIEKKQGYKIISDATEDIIRLGFTFDEYMELENYFDKTINKENVSLISLLQTFYDDKTFCETYKDIITMGYSEENKEKAYNYYLRQTESIKNKIAIILDYYLSKKRVEASGVVEMMRAQLDSLIKIRDNIDKQINELTSQINNLTAVNKGARK